MTARRRSAAIILLLLMALPLTACGKRGAPEPPPGEKNEYPKSYPNPHDPENQQ